MSAAEKPASAAPAAPARTASPQPTPAAPWRSEAAREQEQALSAGAVTITCPAPYGGGGLGRHLEELIEAAGRRGVRASVICETPRAGSAAIPAPAQGFGVPEVLRAARPLFRLAPGWRMLALSTRFDADAARRLPAADSLLAFNGTALAQFRAAAADRSLGRPELVSANSHIEQMLERHRRAHSDYPVERSWAARLGPRNLREYELAERIHCSSRYVHDSFLQRGFPEERLVRFPLTPHPRFQPAPGAQQRPTFDIVYCGSLVVHKGVPLLIDAFSRIPGDDVRLVLVGGFKTRAMRRYLGEAIARDPRIELAPGDPLPRLQQAGVCAHPAYEDGFAYAPAEALACGVPVIVSEDTGMKELIGPGAGTVVPTGEVSALAEALLAATRGEVAGAA